MQPLLASLLPVADRTRGLPCPTLIGQTQAPVKTRSAAGNQLQGCVGLSWLRCLLGSPSNSRRGALTAAELVSKDMLPSSLGCQGAGPLPAGTSASAKTIFQLRLRAETRAPSHPPTHLKGLSGVVLKCTNVHSILV